MRVDGVFDGIYGRIITSCSNREDFRNVSFVRSCLYHSPDYCCPHA